MRELYLADASLAWWSADWTHDVIGMSPSQGETHLCIDTSQTHKSVHETHITKHEICVRTHDRICINTFAFVFAVFLYIYVFIIFPFININHVLSPSVSVGGHSGHPSL